MGKIKVAIIGCGTICNVAHAPSYVKNPEVEIVYFCDTIKEKADAAVEKYKTGKAVYDYHEILNSDIDAVSVCTPNNVHAQISIDFLKAGKHVLCEKPAARTFDEVQTMQKAQHESGKTLNIGVVNRFNTAVNLIKDYIKSGKLGEVYHVYLSFRGHRNIPGLGGSFTTKEISGGGVLIDWGVHYLDLAMYCCGDPTPKTVSCESFCKLGKNMHDYAFTGEMWGGGPYFDGKYDVDDSIAGLIRTSGPVFTINGAWAQNIGVNETYVDFMGDKAGIRLQYGGTFKVFTSENGALVEYEPQYNVKDMFQNEIDAFVNCIKTGEKAPSHIDTVAITAKMMQAIYDSADTHKEITLNAD